MKSRVVVYGLSTEGYSLACQMAIKGADVSMIDESTSSAITLRAEIARTYPNVSALREDEPLLPMRPIDVAVSKAQYLFFAPVIRKTGQDTRVEIYSKFKDAVQSVKKNSSIVYCIPTGFGGNHEIIALLEHVTGFRAGKSVNYFYYPASTDKPPRVLGSLDGRPDDRLAELLTAGKKAPRPVHLSSSEHFHASDVLARFSGVCGILEVCKFAQEDVTRADLASDGLADIFLDDMVNGMYDLRSLASSLEGANTMMYMINAHIRGIDNYVKRLIDTIRATIKRHELKASRTKLALAWTLDKHEMRGDRIEMLHDLTARLRDYVGDVEAYEDPNVIFHSDKTMIIVPCSKKDYDNIIKNKNKNGDKMMVIKATPLYETVQ